MKLEGREWRDTYLLGKDMFSIKRFKSVTTTNLDEENGVLDIVGATSNNNGNVLFANKKYEDKLVNKNKICLIKTGQGSVGDAVYKGNDFVPSNNISLIIKKDLNKFNASFIVTLINKGSDKYSYGYIRNDKRIAREKLVLPITQKGTPDWQFMEKYAKSIFEKKEEKYIDYIKGVLETLTYKKIKKLEEKEWREFPIESIGEIVSGKDIYSAERIDGNTPYISATSKNNGIGYFVGNSNKTLEKNCLSVNRNGSVGYSFYHPYKGLFSNDCRKIRLKYDSTLVGFFISNQITKQKNKYNYGYKMGTGRIKRQKILLPINSKNEPDYAYMEQYIRNMKYRKIKQYLVFKGEG